MNDIKNKPSVILVLGMHRSGTSLVSHLIAQWGAYMGNDLMPADEHNPDGYWESIGLTQFNDKLLEHTGNNWFAPPSSVDIQLLMDFYGDEAHSLVTRMDQSQTVWCWKDPRMVVLLPFWLEVLKDRKIIFIVVYRNPKDVVNSLKKRDNLSESAALALWEFSYSRIAETLQPVYPRMVISYEALLSDPLTQCIKINNFLASNLNETKKHSIADKMVQIVKPSLSSSGQVHCTLSNQQKGVFAQIEQAHQSTRNNQEGCINYNPNDILQYHKNSHSYLRFFIQTFIKSGLNEFNEKDSLIQRYQTGIQKIQADLRGYQQITALRLDPLNDWLVFKVNKVELITNTSSILITNYSSNAYVTENQFLIFCTIDPQIVFDLSPYKNLPVEKAIFHVDYIAVGDEARVFFSNHFHTANQKLFKKSGIEIPEHYTLETLSALVNAQTEMLRQRILEAEEQIKHKEQSMASERNQMLALSTEIESMKISNQAQKNEIENLVAQSSKWEKLHQESTLEIRLLNQKLTEEKYLTVQQGSEIEQLKNLHTKKQAFIEDQLKAIANLNHSLTLSQNQLINQQNKIDQFLDTLREKEQFANGLQNKFLQLSELFTSQQIQRKEFEELSDKREKHLEERTRQLDEIKKLNNILTQQVQQLRDQVEISNKQVSALEANGLAHKLELEDLDYKIKELNSSLQTERERTAYLNQRLGIFYKSLSYKLIFWSIRLNPLYLARKIGEQIKIKRYQQVIKNNPLFDTEYYLKINPDVYASGIDPAKHYLLHGGFEGRNPSPGFHSLSYYVLNPDVARAGINPLLHYILYGVKEGRALLKAMHENDPEGQSTLMKAEASLINTFNAFDEAFYLDGNPDVRESGMTALEHYLRHGWKEARKPNPNFTPNGYSAYGYEVQKCLINPLTHSLLYSKLLKVPGSSSKNQHERRVIRSYNPVEGEIPEYFQTNPAELTDEYKTLLNSQINWSDFFKQNKIPHSNLDPITYFNSNWMKENLVIPGFFDTRLYLEIYPDIAKAGFNPLVHFLNHGINEKRIGYLNAEKYFHKGKFAYDPKKSNYLIACHESSATGAPLVGLNLGSELSKKHNIIYLIMREDSLNSDFLEHSSLLLSDIQHFPHNLLRRVISDINKEYPIDVAICNSIVTLPILEALSQMRIPSVILLHEFSCYSKPEGQISRSIVMADRVVVPAKIIENSALEEYNKIYKPLCRPDNIKIAPQGKLPYIPEGYGGFLSVEELKKEFRIKDKPVKVIIGAGYIHIRKGVDLFISVAEKIKKIYKGEIRFVWVGDGYQPETDFSYSLWLKVQVESSIIKDDFIFLDHQKNLDNLLKLTDCFLMTSRLDPFPNVVIDALYADVYVGCFENTTGCAEFIQKHDAVGDVVPYLDVQSMAEKVCRYLMLPDDQIKKLKGQNKRVVEKHLNFIEYTQLIEEESEKAKTFLRKRVEIEHNVKESKLFNKSFFPFYNGTHDALDFYIKTSLKGIQLADPLPGFSGREWINTHKSVNGPKLVPLYEAIKNKEGVSTHPCIVLKGENLPVDFSIAVHVHLYFPELAREISSYLTRISSKFDLYITLCDIKQKEWVLNQFQLKNATLIEVIEVENIGRDIAPFFIHLKDKLLNRGYDVVGHFHSKKSNDFDKEAGARWRKFLFDNLLGEKEKLNQLFNLFKDKKLGLVFTEDPYSVDISENRDCIDEICQAAGLPLLENIFIFPVGNMFWARPKALLPLFNTDLTKFLQPEPLPYDGTYMHAIERLIPHCAESQGFNFKTVYTPGTVW